MNMALGITGLALLGSLGLALAWLGARRRLRRPESPGDPADQPWILFSRVLMDLAFRHPAFIRVALARLGGNHVDSVLLDACQIENLRRLVQTRQWQELDHFPRFTVLEMENTIWRADRERRQARGRPVLSVRPSAAPQFQFAPLEPLGLPARGPATPPGGGMKKIGAGLMMGEELDPALAPYAADSLRLAELLNRLALNPPEAAKAPFLVEVNGRRAASPRDLFALLLACGHLVEVRDGRYFANFGGLTYRGRDVFTPFWLDTGLPLPGGGRTLWVPVTHTEHEFALRGPLANAEVAFYFGADGQVGFRPNVVRNQAWIFGRIAHRYRGAGALEAVRLAGAIIRRYAALQKRERGLPLGGYLTLGVCNDVNAAIELHLAGQATIYPLTRAPEYFDDEEDEVDQLMRRLPVDGREGSEVDVARLLDSLPVDDLAQIPWPALRRDLELIKSVECGARSGD